VPNLTAKILKSGAWQIATGYQLRRNVRNWLRHTNLRPPLGQTFACPGAPGIDPTRIRRVSPTEVRAWRMSSTNAASTTPPVPMTQPPTPTPPISKTLKLAINHLIGFRARAASFLLGATIAAPLTAWAAWSLPLQGSITFIDLVPSDLFLRHGIVMSLYAEGVAISLMSALPVALLSGFIFVSLAQRITKSFLTKNCQTNKLLGFKAAVETLSPKQKRKLFNKLPIIEVSFSRLNERAAKLEAEASSVADLEHKIAELELLKQQVGALTSEKEEVTQRAQQAERAKSEAKQRKNELEQEVKTNKDIIKTLQTKNEKLDRTIKKQNKALAALKITEDALADLKTELAELQKQIKELKTKKGRLNEKLESANTLAKNLQQELRKKEVRIQELSQDILEVEGFNTNLTLKISEVEARAERSGLELVAANTTIAEERARADQFLTELRTAEKEVQKLSRQLTARGDELEEQKQAVAQAKAALQKLEAAKTATSEELTKARLDLQNARDDFAKKEAGHEQLKKALGLAQTGMEKLNNELEGTKRRLAAKTKQVEELEAQQASTDGRLLGLSIAKSSLTTSLEREQTRHAELEQGMTAHQLELEAELRQTAEKLTAAEQVNQQAQALIIELKAAFKRAEQRRAQAIHQRDQQLVAARKSSAAKTAEITGLENEVTSLRRELAELRVSLTTQLGDATQKIIELEKNLTKTNQAKQRLAETLTTLQAEHRDQGESLRLARQNLGIAERAGIKLSRELAWAQKEQDAASFRLESQLAASQAETARVEAEFNQAGQAQFEFSTQAFEIIEAQNQQINKLTNELEIAQDFYRQQKRSFEIEVEDLHDQQRGAEDQISGLEIELATTDKIDSEKINDLKKQLALAHRELEATAAYTTNEVQRLQNELRQARNKIREVQRRLKTELQRSSSLLRRANLATTKISRELAESQADQALMLEAVTALYHSEQEAMARAVKAEARLEGDGQAIATLTAEKRELATLLHSTKADLKELRQQHTELTGTLVTAEETTRKLKMTIKVFKTGLEDLARGKAEAEQRLVVVEQQRDQVREQLHRARETQTSLEASRNQENQRLRTRQSKLEEEIAKLERQITSLETQLRFFIGEENEKNAAAVKPRLIQNIITLAATDPEAFHYINEASLLLGNNQLDTAQRTELLTHLFNFIEKVEAIDLTAEIEEFVETGASVEIVIEEGDEGD